MPKRSRLLKELRHQPVSGHCMFHNPDVQSQQSSYPDTSANEERPSPTDMSPARVRAPKRKVLPVPEASVLMECTTCLEEQLWPQAFASLSSEVAAGADTQTPARLPPPPYLALAATLTVHPSFTTRTDDPLKHQASADALRYLRTVVAAVDPKDAGLREAFHFGGFAGRQDRSKRAATRVSNAGVGNDDENETSKIRNQYANKQSLANNAEDFWAVVGWAFNCSVKHKARWERWKAWLGLMLDILQDDLATCATRGVRGTSASETLIAQYLSNISSGRNDRRRIMRAILADGSARSTGEFQEIWKKETKPPKKKDNVRSPKRQKLDVENGEFGDYFDNESDEESPDTRAGKSHPTGTRRGKLGSEGEDKAEDSDDNGASTSEASDFGGEDSVRLRQRFFRLLTYFTRADDMQNPIFVDTEELFSLFTEFIRPLPLNVFQQFVLPQTPYMEPDLHASLVEMLFRPLLGSGGCNGAIDQAEFERSFASCAAVNTSAEDNAKVSLLSESLLRALWKESMLSDDLGRLKALVMNGVQARSQKVASDGRRKAVKKAGSVEEAKAILQCSADRMDVLLSVLAG